MPCKVTIALLNPLRAKGKDWINKQIACVDQIPVFVINARGLCHSDPFTIHGCHPYFILSYRNIGQIHCRANECKARNLRGCHGTWQKNISVCWALNLGVSLDHVVWTFVACSNMFAASGPQGEITTCIYSLMLLTVKCQLKHLLPGSTIQQLIGHHNHRPLLSLTATEWKEGFSVV